jgi:hypothetical protein
MVQVTTLPLLSKSAHLTNHMPYVPCIPSETQIALLTLCAVDVHCSMQFNGRIGYNGMWLIRTPLSPEGLDRIRPRTGLTSAGLTRVHCIC